MPTPNITVTPEKFQLVLGVNDDITLSVTNVGFEPVLYRLLTTAPERYVVKHTKGVVRGNSTAKITITLNPKNVQAAAKQQAQPTRVMKDDFRLEAVVQGPEDVVEPRSSNVPQLIKDKKAADPACLLKKFLRCHVLLDAADAASTITSPQGTAGGEAASRAAGARMSARELQENTWLEKNRRREEGGGDRAAAAQQQQQSGRALSQGNGAGAAESSRRVKMLLIVLALFLAGAVWMLME